MSKPAREVDHKMSKGSKMEQKPLTLHQNVAIKAIESKDEGILIIKGIASMYRTPEGFLQVDRDNELVNLDFMDLESYRKNPILCFQHDWSQPMGKVIDIEHKDGALHITAEVHRLTGSENIFESVQKGIIKSLSIGMVPHDFVYREMHDGDILEVARSTLVEISLTTVQSNQEALFDVVAQKSPTISKKTLAMQNGMTCDELDGSCAFKSELRGTQKGIEMDIIKKEPTADELEAARVAKEAEDKVIKDARLAKEVEDARLAKEVEDARLAKEVEDARLTKEAADKSKEATAFDEKALVAAIVEAQEKSEELATQKKEKKEQDAAEEKAQAEADAKARIDAAINYIKERKDAIIATPSEDFDTDDIEEFYELVSEAAEAIEEKVSSIIAEQLGSTE